MVALTMAHADKGADLYSARLDGAFDRFALRAEAPAMQMLPETVALLCEARTFGDICSAIMSGLGKFGFHAFAYVSGAQTVMVPPAADVPLHQVIRCLAAQGDGETSQGTLSWSLADAGSAGFSEACVTALLARQIGSGVTVRFAGGGHGDASIVALSHDSDRASDIAGIAVYLLGRIGFRLAASMGVFDPPAAQADGVHLLSRPQLEILHWVQQGKSNNEIAQITNRTPRLVAYHMSEIFKKLGVAKRAQAAAIYTSRREGRGLSA